MNAKLQTCHPDLIRVFEAAMAKLPIIIVCGHRTKEEQDAAVASGHSQTPFPLSKHNLLPSRAVDFAPKEPNGRIDWSDVRRFYYFGGRIMEIADGLGVPLRWGADWDGDLELKDNRFNDIGHFELTDSAPLPV